jgi:hypothetical protein
MTSLRRENPSTRQTIKLTGSGLWLWVTLAAAALTLEVVQYAGLGAYLDHIENNVVIIAWQYAHGAPLYELQDGAPRFATYYGPLAYLIELPALFLMGPGVVVSKFTSLTALVATVLLLALRFRRGWPTPTLQGLFVLLAGLLIYSPMSFWVRPDPYETLLVAVAIVSAPSAICLGLCIGLAVNLKAHAFLYFLPIVAEFAAERGWRGLSLVALCAAATFLVPFLAPGISLHDYVTGLAQQIGRRDRSWSRLGWIKLTALGTPLELLDLLFLGVPLMLPLALPLVGGYIPRSQRFYPAVTLTTLIVLVYPATFPGAGAYHFLPLVPVVAEACYRLRTNGTSFAIATFPLLCVAALMTQYNLGMMAVRQGWSALADEAVALAEQDGTQSAQIGYGNSSRSYEISQLARTKLALNGFPVLIDAQTLMELREIGIDGSRRWLPYLAKCHVRRWLLPAGEQPFAIRNYYYDNGPVFGDEFRKAFLTHYRVVATTTNFSIWECRDDPG